MYIGLGVIKKRPKVISHPGYLPILAFTLQFFPVFFELFASINFMQSLELVVYNLPGFLFLSRVVDSWYWIPATIDRGLKETNADKGNGDISTYVCI